jgi:hypothetical protein
VYRTLKFALCALALAILPVSSAAADPPTKTTTTDTFTSVIDNVCSFPITAESTLTTTAITFTGASSL